MFEFFPKSYTDVLDWDWSQFRPYVQDLLARDVDADTGEAWLSDWSDLAKMVWELYSRLHVATTVNTADEDAEKRFQRFLSEIYPEFMKADNALNKKLLESGVAPEGFEVALKNIRADVELFRNENVPLLSEETILSQEYDKISGAQTVTWDGEEKTISQMGLVAQEQDRNRRETAFRAVMKRQLEDRQALNELWNKLLALRLQITENADCDDYREYIWKAKKRFDYSPQDALNFLDAIEQEVVPAAERIFERRRKELGLIRLRPWDLQVETKPVDPLRPFEDVEELESVANEIFNRVNLKLGEFFSMMRDEGLLDLDNRKNKAPGGYCTTFPVTQRPYIFQNAVGIHDDVQTTLHEGGHAFHAFLAGDLPYVHLQDSGIEFAEVASMSMELLAAPYLAKDKGGFYTEAEAARARIEHLESNILFWPYMAVVVGFQHWAYTNPDAAADPTACDAAWTDLWHRFMRGVDYSGLEEWVATGWHRKLHIFHIPFYYIEYGIAQLGAVQVWANSLDNHEAALNAYLDALALGGTASLPALFETAGAKLAFDAEIFAMAVSLMERTIEELRTVA